MLDASPVIQVAPPVLSSQQCRERARRFFSSAVAELDPVRREALFVQGERWMGYWRHWSPSIYIIEDC